MAEHPQHKEIVKLLITVEEAARLMSLGRTKMYQVIKRYHIPHVRNGGRILISPTSLQKWIEDHEQ